LILGRFFSVRQDSAMLPLLLIFTAFKTLRKTQKPPATHSSCRISVASPLSPPFHRVLKDAASLNGTFLAGKIKPPKIGMFRGKAGAFL
jgi:hypothetical protein